MLADEEEERRFLHAQEEEEKRLERAREKRNKRIAVLVAALLVLLIVWLIFHGPTPSIVQQPGE